MCTLFEALKHEVIDFHIVMCIDKLLSLKPNLDEGREGNWW